MNTTKDGERMQRYDTMPILPLNCDYDFRLRPEGWQLVVVKVGMTWVQAMEAARTFGLSLDQEGYLLK